MAISYSAVDEFIKDKESWKNDILLLDTKKANRRNLRVQNTGVPDIVWRP